jgi:hypothetical protein
MDRVQKKGAVEILPDAEEKRAMTEETFGK